jgi:hypothetical protein
MEGYLDAYNPKSSVIPAGIFINRVEVWDFFVELNLVYKFSPFGIERIDRKHRKFLTIYNPASA